MFPVWGLKEQEHNSSKYRMPHFVESWSTLCAAYAAIIYPWKAAASKVEHFVCYENKQQRCNSYRQWVYHAQIKPL